MHEWRAPLHAYNDAICLICMRTNARIPDDPITCSFGCIRGRSAHPNLGWYVACDALRSMLRGGGCMHTPLTMIAACGGGGACRRVRRRVTLFVGHGHAGAPNHVCVPYLCPAWYAVRPVKAFPVSSRAPSAVNVGFLWRPVPCMQCLFARSILRGIYIQSPAELLRCRCCRTANNI